MSKVIVVDDDYANAQLTRMLLELDGFDVHVCNNLQQAQDVSQPDIDAYVVDVNLARGESGLDLLRRIRRGETGAAPDTVFLVTSGDHRRANEALEMGADEFLLKPYSPETLSQRIAAHIEGRSNG